MRRVLAGLIMVLAGAGASSVAAQPAGIPPAPVVKPGPPGPHVEDPSKLPEPPKATPDLAYDSRVLSSAASAELFQGPLDGPWTLGPAGRDDLYALELVDKRDRLEGAWRDLRRTGQPDASGAIDQLQRTPTGLELRFTPKGQAPVKVSLKPNLTGEMEQAGVRTQVNMRRKAR